MNIALIFAGGTGKRMNSRSKPKQFLDLYGKPILIHTLEYFDCHPEIHGICVVCLKGWEEKLRHLLDHYGIEKVRWITAGGDTGHESIYNGLAKLREECGEDDIVLIHDGVRPLITQELISQNIATVKEKGNSVTVEKVAESVVMVSEDRKISEIPPREEMRIAKAPQCFYLKDIWEVHEMAGRDGFYSVDSAHLMNHYGRELFTVESTPYNIKIATPSDYYVLRALYEARENSQIFGL